MLRCQQPCSGVYNEHVFQAMDYVLDQASQHGMRVIIALTDYWKITDGVQQARLACAHAQLDITSTSCTVHFRSCSCSQVHSPSAERSLTACSRRAWPALIRVSTPGPVA